MSVAQPFHLPSRLLLGPGPSMVSPRVLDAMRKPLVGHLDPAFGAIMEDIKSMLRAIFQTQHATTFPVSGTGTAGMEFCLVNLVEPGDEVVIGVNGVFGLRMADAAERCGARVIRVEAPWGRIIDAGRIRDAARNRRPALIGIVHAETSTGVWTPVEEIASVARDSGALLLLDAVTSLAGCPVKIDEWGVDAVFSGTQKCLSCPPGLAPVSLSDRAVAVARNRKTKVRSWYLDVNLLMSYWNDGRAYHHTAPVSMNYALHEALRIVLEEGIDSRWTRHQRNHNLLKRGLASLGLEIWSQPGHQLWQLNAVAVPAGVDEAAVRARLLTDFGIEIGGGMGPLKGKIWRIGLMGESSTEDNVEIVLNALGQILSENAR